MLNENDKTPSCKDCKYFVQHYVRFKTNFHELNCGHCVNYKIPRNKKQSLPPNGCNKWEQAEKPKNADTVEQIKNAVSSMQKQLDSIASVLSYIKPG